MSNGEPSIIDRIFNYQAAVVTAQAINQLKDEIAPRQRGARTSQPEYSDALLLYAANSELCSTVSLALCVDEYDAEMYADQQRFMAAYDQFRGTIAGLSNSVLRASVELPESYISSINDSLLLSYARPRPGGRPTDWKKDEFYLRILTVYQMTIGRRPSGSEGGPTIRFMRAVVSILRHHLATVSDKTTKEFSLVNALWRLPRNDSFLKEWYRAKGGQEHIQQRVDASVQHNIAAYDRHVESGSFRNNVIHAAFGGKSSPTDQG